MRPIDADALKESLVETFEKIAKKPDITREERHAVMLYQMLCEMIIGKTQTIDSAPVVHASWIRQDNSYTRFQCGECKSENFDRCWVFCPLCGAKMDGGWKHDEA